ncbi:coenzyme F420-0:L-glutamate ligase [Streptomyces triculaminicus]|uniref:coenzyme F420-0:L-glutamate ligase n=1 Tax=Streptomyces triculaminicus TaxID=2816232 RepID=UPI0033F7FE9C
MSSWDMTLRAVPGIPNITPGDDLGALIVKAVVDDGHELADGDVLVVAQKIVSKAEDRVVRLDTITPTDRAQSLADRTGRDPRLCQLYLDESRAVLEIIGRHVITLDNRGIVDTSGGVDSSNAGVFAEGWACLLPVDPDASARRIRDRIRTLTGTTVAVIISDSLGNPHREGSIGAAIGLAGIAAVEKPTPGDVDLYGNPMWGDLNRVDELAGAASALMGQSNAARPAVLVRGATYAAAEDASLRDLLVAVPDPANDADLVTE